MWADSLDDWSLVSQGSKCPWKFSMDILTFEDETITLSRIVGHQLSSDAALHSRRTETTALVPTPKSLQHREVKYFCTCVANHSFRVLCFHVNVTCILETDMTDVFMVEV
jgi:hypothetical protein